MISNEEKDLRVALLMKSDDELRAIINESGIYGKELIRAAREELTARVAGKSRQKSEEEIRAEEERQRREEEERRRQAEEGRRRKEAEAIAERARRKAVAHRRAKRVSIIAVCIVVVGAVVGFFIWNNTDERLVERGQKALAEGNHEKAEKLFERAENTSADAAYELWKLKWSDYYLIKAADLGHDEACKVYGKQLIQQSKFDYAIFYLKKANRVAEQQYLLGCAYWAVKNWDAAQKALEAAVDRGYTRANVWLGDWYLCQGELKDYLKALEYYEAAPSDWPGIQEKRQVLRDLKERNRNFETDRWKGAQFWGEGQIVWNNWQSRTRSVRRGIYKNTESKYRFIGKFNTTGKLLSGLGIVVYRDGSVYVGHIQVVNAKNNKYSIYYTGHGVHTDSYGVIETGTWKKDKLVGSYTRTNIFGETETVNQ